MRGLTSIRSAVQPIGTIFGETGLGGLSIAAGAFALGLTPASIACFLVAAACFGGARLLTEEKTRKQAAENTKRLKGLAISDKESFDLLRQRMVENALDPRLLDELKDADEDGDPPALAIMLTLFQASQNHQLEYILTQNSNLHEALVSHLQGQAKRLQEMHTDIVRAAERARAFPTLRLPIQTYDPDHHRNPYFFSLQRVPFLGRDTEVRELLDFCLADGNDRIWWLWHGPSGFGKSRLAHETCLHLLERRRWCVGRLDLREEFNEWSRVELTADTLFVIDYAAEHPQRAAKAIATLYENRAKLSDHNHRVRFLLLERSAEGPWKETFDRGSSPADQPLLESSAYRVPRELGNLDFDSILDIVDYIFKERALTDRIDGGALLHLLNNVDPLNRPLYAAILADAIAERGFESVRHWGQDELLDHVLDVEMGYWSQRGVDSAHVNALVLATLSGDLLLTGHEVPTFIKGAQDTGLLPRPKQRHWQTLGDFASVFGLDTRTPLPALQPDILGEKFILDRLIGERRLPEIEDRHAGEEPQDVEKQTAQLLRLARLRARDATAITTLRCLRDHHQHIAIDRLLAPPADDPVQAEAWSKVVPDGVILLSAMGDLDRANQLYTDLAAIADGERSVIPTTEIRFERARAGVNLVHYFGETQDPARLDRTDVIYRELVAVAERADATAEIRLARAQGGVNLALGCEKSGDVGRAVELLRESRAILLELDATEHLEHVDGIIARIQAA